MADIINFQQYVNFKEEEKRCIKRISTLSTIIDNIEGLLHSINNSIGCSIVTKYFGENKQIVGKESILDSNMLCIIVQALDTYRNMLYKQIDTLEKCMKNNYQSLEMEDI